LVPRPGVLLRPGGTVLGLGGGPSRHSLAHLPSGCLPACLWCPSQARALPPGPCLGLAAKSVRAMAPTSVIQGRTSVLAKRNIMSIPAWPGSSPGESGVAPASSMLNASSSEPIHAVQPSSRSLRVGFLVRAQRWTCRTGRGQGQRTQDMDIQQQTGP